jgi:hypothetical protein
LKTANLFELGLLLGVWLLATGILLVNGAEQLLEQNEVLTSFEIVNFDVSEVGVDAESQIGSEGVWCSGPSEKRSGRVVD